MKSIWKIYTISLWVRLTRNFRRRNHRKTPSSQLRQANTLLDTWWYLRSSASQTNIIRIQYGLYDWRPGNYTTMSSMKTRIRPINWSYYVMHRRSTRMYSISYQYPRTSLPGWQSNWNSILARRIEIAVRNPSWPRHRRPYPSHICQPSWKTLAPRFPRLMQK